MIYILFLSFTFKVSSPPFRYIDLQGIWTVLLNLKLLKMIYRWNVWSSSDCNISVFAATALLMFV